MRFTFYAKNVHLTLTFYQREIDINKYLFFFWVETRKLQLY